MHATFNELAEAELNDAIGYYETEQVGLGAAFLAEIRRSTAAIIEYPEASPPIHGTFGVACVRGFRTPCSTSIMSIRSGFWR